MLWYFPLELWKTPQKKRCIPVCTSQHAYHGVPTNAKQKCTVYAQYTAQKRIVGKALFFCGNLLREPFYAIYDFSFQVFFSFVFSPFLLVKINTPQYSIAKAKFQIEIADFP